MQWLGEHPWLIAGARLVAVGAIQLSDLKGKLLEACRTLNHLDSGEPARQGIPHGITWLGASGGLMLLTFALMASNLFGMAAMTLLMVLESTPLGTVVTKPIGLGLVALGVVDLAGPISPPTWWHL